MPLRLEERMFYHFRMRLSDPWVSYFVGLSQTDGHLRETTRNRGRLSIELGRRDEDVLLRLAHLNASAIVSAVLDS